MMWISLYVFTIWAVIEVHRSASAQSLSCLDVNFDPCDSDHHKILNDTSRSAGYTNHVFSDDYMLLPGWYRSVSIAGGNIPMEPPLNFHCNAYTPMWMKGRLPANNGRIVKRTICVRHYTGTCVRSHEICVKNCVTYNVFYLYTPEGASDRYCFGNEAPCKQGYVSKTGFSPGCEKDEKEEEIQHEPQITYKIKETEIGSGRCMDHVVYQCNQEGLDTVNTVQVYWSIDKQQIKEEPIQVSRLPSELTTKDILNSKHVKTYGFQVTCTIELVNKEGQTIAKTANFYAGYNVNRTVIYAEEGGQPGYYEIDFTVPCTCSHICGRPRECDIPVNIEVPKQGQIEEPLYDYNPVDDDEQCVAHFNEEDEIVFETVRSKKGGEQCTSTIKMSSSQRSETYILPVYARLDGRYDGDKVMALQLRTASQLEDKLCQGIVFPRAQVVVVDKDEDLKGKACHLYNVAHAKTFDGRKVDMGASGFFILYQHKTLPIEIQGYFQDVGHYSRVCGAAVRSGGELYVVNYCGTPGFYNKMYQCDKIHDGANQLKIFEDGHNRKIHLQTGGVVSVTPERIKIEPSLVDVDKTEGLCGNLNGNIDDDIVTVKDSWRVDEEKSLFFGKIYDRRRRQFGDIVFCDCDNADQATCGYTQTVEHCISSSERERDVAYRLRRHCSMTKRQADKYSDDVDDFDDLVFEYNEDFTPPKPVWRNGWNNVTAQAFCEQFIYNSTSAQLCKNITGVDLEQSIEDCVSDIHVTGETEHVNVHLDLIVSTCQSEIEKNDTMMKTMLLSDGKSILGQLCPGDCSRNGVCVNGTCLCKDTYIGTDCSIDSSVKPVLQPLPSQGKCDKHIRPCKAIAVHGNMFVDTDTLMCRVQLKQDNIEVYQYFKAQFENFQKVMCPLPTDPKVPYTVSIAVSNDNHTYSVPQGIVVFDSTCWDCDMNHLCKLKENKCEINNECFHKGDKHPTDKTHCHPETSQLQWSNGEFASSGSGTKKITLSSHFIISLVGALLFSAITIV